MQLMCSLLLECEWLMWEILAGSGDGVSLWVG